MLKESQNCINSIRDLQSLGGMQQMKFSKSPIARIQGDFMQQTSIRKDYYDKKLNAFENYKSEIKKSINEVSNNVIKSP